MSLPSSQVERDRPAERPLPHSRIGLAAFAVSILSIFVSGHLVPLLAMGVGLGHVYLITCQWTAAILSVVGIVLAVAALFDTARNRFFGMLGWWLGIIALSTLAISIRIAVRHHLMRL